MSSLSTNPSSTATPEVPPSVLIRRYESRDREAVRYLCCETGFLGKAIDPVFEDREIFADYLTRYYTDIEPESSFVLEQDGVVKGYLLGSYRPFRQQLFNFFNNLSLFARGMAKFPFYNKPTRDFIGWILRNSWKEVPTTPRRSAHFHFNMLPEVQGMANTGKLMNGYLEHLRSKGVRQVYGQVVTFETRRGAKLFERYGFQVLDRREITKYRNAHPEPVYLTTVLKELDPR